MSTPRTAKLLARTLLSPIRSSPAKKTKSPQVSVREILDNTRTVALRKKLIAHENVVKYFQEHPDEKEAYYREIENDENAEKAAAEAQKAAAEKPDYQVTVQRADKLGVWEGHTLQIFGKTVKLLKSNEVVSTFGIDGVVFVKHKEDNPKENNIVIGFRNSVEVMVLATFQPELMNQCISTLKALMALC